MKILLPVDGSESSKNAVKHALNLAKNHSSVNFIVITVINLSDFQRARDFMANPEKIIEAAKENYDSILRDTKEMFDAEGVSSVETALIESGDTAEAIVNTAKQQGVDQIIMGTRGMSSLKSFALGSIANKVISHVTIPVTLIH